MKGKDIMSNERLLKPVEDMKDKQMTYAFLKSKRKEAVKQEFYFESIHISYAIIEDRTRSFFYHLGYLETRKEFCKCARGTNEFFKVVFRQYVSKNKLSKKNKTISGLENKLILISAVTEFVKENAECRLVPKKYYELLRNRMEKYGFEKVLDIVEETRKWKALRNEITHALANKTIFDFKDRLKKISDDGIIISNKIDEIVKVIKSQNLLRKHLGFLVE